MHMKVIGAEINTGYPIDAFKMSARTQTTLRVKGDDLKQIAEWILKTVFLLKQ